MSRKTGVKWKTEKCGRCGEQHLGYSGKINADGKEYVVCGKTGKPMMVNPFDFKIDDIAYITKWEKEMVE
jgi:ribosomal protein S27AE